MGFVGDKELDLVIKDEPVCEHQEEGLMFVYWKQELRIQMESRKEDVRVLGERRNSKMWKSVSYSKLRLLPGRTTVPGRDRRRLH